MPAFVLLMGKGKPKLKESDGSGEPGCRPQPQRGPAEPGVIPLNVFVCRNVTMETFAQLIHNYANGYLTSPTVDSTNLKGSWDFELKWTSRGALVQAGPDGISLFDAVDKQLGLKLERNSSGGLGLRGETGLDLVRNIWQSECLEAVDSPASSFAPPTASSAGWGGVASRE